MTHTAARQLLRGHGPRDHITPTLQQLHWQVSTSILEPLSQARHPWLRHAMLPIPDNSDRPSDETNFSVFRTNRRIKSRAFSVS